MENTDCVMENERFLHWMENEYMKSDYTECIDFPEYLGLFEKAKAKQFEELKSRGC